VSNDPLVHFCLLKPDKARITVLSETILISPAVFPIFFVRVSYPHIVETRLSTGETAQAAEILDPEFPTGPSDPPESLAPLPLFQDQDACHNPCSPALLLGQDLLSDVSRTPNVAENVLMNENCFSPSWGDPGLFSRRSGIRRYRSTPCPRLQPGTVTPPLFLHDPLSLTRFLLLLQVLAPQNGSFAVPDRAVTPAVHRLPFLHWKAFLGSFDPS